MSNAPLLLLGGAALLLMTGKKKKSSGSSSKGNGACPPVVHIEKSGMPIEWIEVQYETEDGLENAEISIFKAAYHEAVDGNRNIIDITMKVLAPFIPPDCVISESIKVKLRSDGDTTEFKAVEFFYIVGMEILQDLHKAGLFGEEAPSQANELNKWWVSHMGEAPLPTG